MSRRIALVFAGSIGMVAAIGDAHAEIPYADQLTPGELRGIAWDPGDEWVYGYWEYLPTTFDALGPDDRLPLLVFLPGIGEYDEDPACPGNADVCTADDCGSDGLCRNLTWGPQSLIRAGAWDEAARPYIVLSPQHPIPPFATTDWDIDDLDLFFQFVVDNYPVDARRMYLTGMSQGGRGVLQYTTEHARRFTAVAPMPGGVVSIEGVGCTFQDTGFWAFHGEDDNNANLGAGVFSPCAMVGVAHMYDHPDEYMQYDACSDAVGSPHPPGRFTMFDDVGHSSWVQAIDPIASGFPASEWPSDEGCGVDASFREYDAVLDADGVYSWFSSLDRPDVVAPDDALLPGETSSTSLVAAVTDDDAVAFQWTQTAGPPATLVVADAAELELEDLAPETAYTFEVYALDADGQWDRDDVTVTLGTAPVGGSSESSGSDGTEGATDTSAEGSASASASASADDTGASEGSASASASATQGDGPSDASASDDSADETSDTGDDGSAVGEENPGCGCAASERRSAHEWVVLAALFGLRRRRSVSAS